MNTTMDVQERKPKISDGQAMLEVMALLDEWQAPEPSSWFEARMMARFREEQQREPEGWFARLRDQFALGSAPYYKPVLAGAMAVALVAGCGSYYGLSHMHHSAPASATLQDLQVIDNNDQAIQQMDQLLDGPDDTSNGSAL